MQGRSPGFDAPVDADQAAPQRARRHDGSAIIGLVRSSAARQALRGVAHTSHSALPGVIVNMIALSDRAALAEGVLVRVLVFMLMLMLVLVLVLVLVFVAEWMDSIGHGEECDELVGLTQFFAGSPSVTQHLYINADAHYGPYDVGLRPSRPHHGHANSSSLISTTRDVRPD